MLVSLSTTWVSSCRPREDSECEETPGGDMTANKQPKLHEYASPSQLQEAGANKARAEAKLWARKIGAGELGATWMKLLVPEFKKDYFTKVLISNCCRRKERFFCIRSACICVVFFISTADTDGG